MADTFGPFDGLSWSQAQWFGVAKAWAPSGIFGTPAAAMTAGAFAATSSGLSLTIAAAGSTAWIRGAGYQPDTNKTFTVPANANATLFRRDRIVFRRDLVAKTVTVERLTGTPASTPAAPVLTQSDIGTWEEPICSFLVPPASATGLSGFVDERVWVDPGGRGVNVETTGRSPITTTGKVVNTTALTGVIIVPPIIVPSRVVFTALGRAGFATGARSVAWDWDSVPGVATNVANDYDGTQVDVAATQWTTVVSSLTMDLPAYAVPTARLLLRSSGDAYSRGAVTWYRTTLPS